MKLYHIERKAFLQWMRATYDAINLEVFGGELPRVTIQIENPIQFPGQKSHNALAQFIAFRKKKQGPRSMFIRIRQSNAYFESIETALYPLIIMAHEMIHVYCFLHGITDHDRTDYHNKSFLEVAEKHGMYCREYHTDIGYSDVWLTDEQIDRVIVRIPDEIWDAMTSNIKFVNVRKSIQKFLCIEYDDEFASEAYD